MSYRSGRGGVKGGKKMERQRSRRWRGRAGGEERTEGFGAYGEGEVPGVLSVWTEKRKPQTFAGSWGCVEHIEPVARAGMEGMLLALQPRVAVDRRWH